MAMRPRAQKQNSRTLCACFATLRCGFLKKKKKKFHFSMLKLTTFSTVSLRSPASLKYLPKAPKYSMPFKGIELLMEFTI